MPAYFVEESLRHLLFVARSHILGDPKRTLERFSKFTFLSMVFPSVYLTKLHLFDPKVAEVEKEFDFVDVYSRVEFVFKPMHKVMLKYFCSLHCDNFVPSSKNPGGTFSKI
jgi:hypothetical protein